MHTMYVLYTERCLHKNKRLCSGHKVQQTWMDCLRTAAAHHAPWLIHMYSCCALTIPVCCYAGGARVRVRGRLQACGQGHTGQGDDHQAAEREAEAAGRGAEEEAGAGSPRRRIRASTQSQQRRGCRVSHPGPDTSGPHPVPRHQLGGLWRQLQLSCRAWGARGRPALPHAPQQPVVC